MAFLLASFLILFYKTSFYSIIIYLFFLFLINCIGEFWNGRMKKSIIYPFLGTFLQLTWFIGFISGFMNIILKKNQHSNFIK